MIAGEIRAFAHANVGSGWLSCDGSAYDQSAHPDLFSAIGTTFGDDGPGTFRVPDLRNRFPLGDGDEAIGATGGAAEVTLTINQLPAHSHEVRATNDDGGSTRPAGKYPARTGEDTYNDTMNDPATMSSEMIAETGGGERVPTLPPYMRVRYYIAEVSG